MKKLVLLSQVNKGKSDLLELENVKNAIIDYTESYADFKEKFGFFNNKNGITDSSSKKKSNISSGKNLNEIMKRVFLAENKSIVINFLNSIYNDDLCENTKIEYIKNNNTIISEVTFLNNSDYNVSILAEDDYRKFEYQIQFYTRDDENIAVIITKVDCLNNCTNIINFNKKKKQYENKSASDLNKSSKDNCSRCLIMLNSNIEVPDVFEFSSNFQDKMVDGKVNVMKSWKYDFKQLFERNMYILFPLKVLDLRKRLICTSLEVISNNLVKDEIIRFIKDMNRYLMKIRDKNLVTNKDITEFNLITMQLLNYCINEQSSLLRDIKTEIEATLKGLVV